MYGKLIDGKLVYAPKNYLTDDNRMIFNFNNNVELMKNNGFKEILFDTLEYDVETQITVEDGYEETDDIITVKYKVIDRPITEIEQLKKDNEDLKYQLDIMSEVIDYILFNDGGIE